MSASKSIINDLNQGEKLNYHNWNVWYRKVQYHLDNEKVLDGIERHMTEPTEVGVSHVDYNAWKKKDKVARILLLISMSNSLFLRFEKHRHTKQLWDAVKINFGGTSTTCLRQLTLRFEGYKKRSNHSMREHLKTMSNMISELSSTGYNMTDEQQVQVVIHSFLKTWEHMRINLTHNDSIRTFENVARHVELEDERLIYEKGTEEAFIVLSNTQKNGGKCKRGKSGGVSSSGASSSKSNGSSKEKRIKSITRRETRKTSLR